MTTTLAWWQIAGLIVLTLILVGILRRWAILIVMGDNLPWCEPTLNETVVPVENPHQISLSDVPSSALGVFTTSVVDGVGNPVEEDVAALGSTGASPGGVSFDPDQGSFIKEKPAKKRYRSKRKGHYMFGGR